MTDQSRLTWALVLSVLLHGLLLTLLPLARGARIEIPAPPSLLDVDVVSLPKVQPPRAAVPAPPQAQPAAAALPLPEKQIVALPDAGEEKAPENPRFLSDRDNTVKEETVRRGEPAAASPEAKRESPQRTNESAKEERQLAMHKAEPERSGANIKKPALPKLDQLLPNPGDLVREGLAQPEAPAAAPEPEQHAANERTDLLRHGDPWRHGSLRGGTLDFLPTIHEGDVTLLNTKAEQFAPFVRRVAMRVLQNFLITLRRNIEGRGGESAQEYTAIEATMDKDGNLVAVKPVDRSLSAALGIDRSLQTACNEGCFDRNPPRGAETNDGNIHFVFEARVATLADPGRGVIGYHWMFGAGLL